MKKIFVILAGLLLTAQLWADCTFVYFTTDGEPLSDQVFARLGTVKSHTFDVKSRKGVVTYSNQVTEIPDEFIGGPKLDRIDLPEGVVSIGKHAFFACKKLHSIHFSSTVTTIGQEAFRGCDALRYIGIPENCKITSLGAGAFNGCGLLEEFTLAEGITAIYDDTFAFCGSLINVNIPETVVSIGMRAFYQCYALQSIIIPEGVTSIGENAFKSSGLTSVVIPDGVEALDAYTFYDCGSLQSAVLPENLKTIGQHAFHNCRSLKSIIIPKSVTSLGDNAFDNCNSLESITCLNPVPPTCNDGTFWSLKTYNVPVYVPCEGLEAYRNATEWQKFGENLHGAAHHFEFDITDDSKAYTCPCGLVNEEVKAQYDARHYFSLTAVDGDVTVGWKKVGTPADYTIQWSEDGIHWSQPETLSESKTLMTIAAGKTGYFRHGSTEAINRISFHQSRHWSFTMTSDSGNATVEAGGNIMSLLDMTCQKNSLAGSPQHVFTGLFKGCDLLRVAPDLPFTTISQFCYMYMFAGTGITEAPELPATTIPDGAYYGMFQDCKQLATAPALVGTRLSRVAYKEMFKGCEIITEVSIADAATGSTGADNPFYAWLDGAAANGKVVVSLPMICNETVAQHLPSGWAWATSLNANEDPENPGSGYYTTFYDKRIAYTIPQGVKAYTARLEDGQEENIIELVRVPGGIIPKGTAVLLHSESAQVPMTTVVSEAPAIDGNEFKGTNADTPQTGEFKHYIFTHGQNGLGFYIMKPGTLLKAYKAYLYLPAYINVNVNVIDNQEGSNSNFEFGAEE